MNNAIPSQRAVLTEFMGRSGVRLARTQLLPIYRAPFDHNLTWRLADGKKFMTTEPYLHGDPTTCAQELVYTAEEMEGRRGWTACPVPPEDHPGFWNPPFTKLFVAAPPGGPTAAEIVATIFHPFKETA